MRYNFVEPPYEPWIWDRIHIE